MKLTETIAILLYCAEKANLDGQTPEEKAQLRMLYGISYDVRIRYARAAYSKDFVDMKSELLEYIDVKLNALEQYLIKNGGTYLTGNKITYMDLVWYDLLDQFLTLSSTCLGMTLVSFY